MALSPRETHLRRAERNRIRLKAVGSGRPRLSVHRSSKHIYAQVIDDSKGVTIAAASSLESGEGAPEKGSDKAAAAAVGKLLAERAKAAGIEAVVFDRGGFVYHGRVKALADAAREAGLSF
jgi:large subunit ribosomal protein L18